MILGEINEILRELCRRVPNLDAPKAKAILAELERGLRAEVRAEDASMTGLDQLDVDHILPRSWSARWPLGDGSAVSLEEASEVELIVRTGLPLNERQRMVADRQSAVRNLDNLTLLNLSVNRQVQL